MSRDDVFPGKWIVMDYGTGQNPADRACWVKHLNPFGVNEIVQAVATPSQAAAMVRKHNEGLGDE